MCVVRLNAVTVLFVGIVSAAFPMHAEQRTASLGQTIVVASNAPETVKLPDFVPVINFDQFLLASQGNDFGDDEVSAEARTAAETLSAKFAGPASGSSDSKFFHAVVQQDPAAPEIFTVTEDPKQPVQIAALSDPDSATDPEKIAEAEPAEAAVETHKPEKPVAHLQTRTPRRAAVARSKYVKPSYVPRQQRRVASASAMSPRSNSAYNGVGADLERLVGFGSLSPDNRLTN
jgi:hypothetical protein